MKLRNNYCIKIITVGLITLTTYLILLGLAQRTLKITTYETLLRGRPLKDALTITPSQLTPDLDSEPNIATPSTLRAKVDEGAFIAGFAALDPLFLPEWPNLHHVHKTVSRYDERIQETKIQNVITSVIYYDNSLNLFVYADVIRSSRHEKWTKKILAYAGPNGIAKSPDKKLGTFPSPLSYCRNLTPQLFVFDENQSRFFRFDFDRMQFKQGPKLTPDQSCCKLGNFNFSSGISISWQPPTTKKYVDQSSNFYPTIHKHSSSHESDKVLREVDMVHSLQITGYDFDHADFIPIIQQDRHIVKLDPDTLTITDQLGFFYNSYSMDDILAYDLKFFFREDQYLGMAAASITRNSKGASLLLFDIDGEVVKIPAENPYNPNSNSYTEAYHNLAQVHLSIHSLVPNKPGGPLLQTTMYLLDNLHPPLLSLASCIRPDHFDALTAERTILFTPNSLSASLVRYENDILDIISIVFVMHNFTLTLGAFLAWRIVRDSRQLGLPTQFRKLWIIAAVALGLPVYITYRLTRPAITRVTCPNCGRLRRPDQQNCANCNAPWHLPDLIPPTWKVTNH